MIFVFHKTTETIEKEKNSFQMTQECQISDQKLLREHTQTRVSCFVVYFVCLFSKSVFFRFRWALMFLPFFQCELGSADE